MDLGSFITAPYSIIRLPWRIICRIGSGISEGSQQLFQLFLEFAFECFPPFIFAFEKFCESLFGELVFGFGEKPALGLDVFIIGKVVFIISIGILDLLSILTEFALQGEDSHSTVG